MLVMKICIQNTSDQRPHHHCVENRLRNVALNLSITLSANHTTSEVWEMGPLYIPMLVNVLWQRWGCAMYTHVCLKCLLWRCWVQSGEREDSGGVRTHTEISLSFWEQHGVAAAGWPDKITPRHATPLHASNTPHYHFPTPLAQQVILTLNASTPNFTVPCG